MSAFTGPVFLAPTGTTGNNTHGSVRLPSVAHLLAIAFIAEAVGTTVTWKTQGTIDPDATADGSAAWFDLPYVLPSTDTLAQVGIVRTTVGEDLIWLAQSHIRFFRRVRLVTSANTGVTYRAELYYQLRI